MTIDWYPIIFLPVYREHSWGGTLLKDHFQRDCASSLCVGESLEIVDQGATQSVVENGAFQGKTLRELMALDAKGMVGKHAYFHNEFPLTIKYIDAAKPLPLQVHPDTFQCHKLKGAKPNSKMWYIVATSQETNIFVGLQRQTTRQQFLRRINTPEIISTIQSFPSHSGDAYFIAAGRPHALGGGNLILSVEQNSLSSYCIGNWADHYDSTPSPHQPPSDIKEALHCIDFHDRTLARICRESSTVRRNRKIPLISTCPSFAVDEIHLIETIHDWTNGKTFHALIAISGTINIRSKATTLRLEKGKVCFIPSSLGGYSLIPEEVPGKILRVSLKPYN